MRVDLALVPAKGSSSGETQKVDLSLVEKIVDRI